MKKSKTKKSEVVVGVSEEQLKKSTAAFHLLVRAIPAAARRLAAPHIEEVQRALGDSTPLERIGRAVSPPASARPTSPRTIADFEALTN